MSHQKYIAAFVLAAIVATSCRLGPAALPQQAPREETPMTEQTPTRPSGPAQEPTVPPAIAAVTYDVPVADRGAGFAPFEPVNTFVEPSVPPYSTTVAELANPDAALSLSPAQQAILAQNGFVVTPAPFAQIYQVYQHARDRGQPIFLTTDALLHTYHILYDFALRDAEINHFVDDLGSLTTEMLAQSQAQIAGTNGDAQRAAMRNLAYFSVAASLLDPTFTPAPEVADLVSAELSLIQAHVGFQPSPIFGYEAPIEYKEDYSQYVPRGHYTRNETFERYFRAMMWYGRIGFRLRPGERPEEVAMGRIETRQAILIAAALGDASVNGESALDVWDRIYEPTVFFVGSADDLTVYDYLGQIRAVYGDTFDPQVLNDEAKLDTFIQEASSLRPPRIVGGYVTDQQDAASVTQSFRFMGQRFVPDAYIFQQLVYDKVGTQNNPRLVPSGLDVASALGSARAYDILLDVYDQGQYANYTQQMETVRAEFAGLPPGQRSALWVWTENLYWGWLHSLSPLLSPASGGYPLFMQSPAWVDKDLHTYLGSWAELKHDTILYAKQSTTIMVTSAMPEPERINGYVEPRPEVFARQASLVNQTRRGLEQRGLLNDEFSDKFTRLEKLLLALKDMAVKELQNESLTEEEQAQIRDIGDTLEGLTTFLSQTEEELASETDERIAIVADVHTDPNTGQVLEEAVGDAFVIWVIAPVDGQPTLTQGGVFSYYEFTWPLADRLSDETWQSLEPKPNQPVWVNSFIVP